MISLKKAEPEDEPQRVVIWSGGADSTLALAQSLQHFLGDPKVVRPSKRQKVCQNNVVALTLLTPDAGSPEQVEAEAQSRATFIRWADRHGWSFRHETIKMDTGTCPTPHGPGVGQHVLWLMHLLPYALGFSGSGIVQIVFGYIKRDQFWHTVHSFRAVIQWFADLTERDVRLRLPLEWHEKCQVLDELKALRVPDEAWWTCEEPVRRRGKLVPCNVCSKCVELRRAREDTKLKLRRFGVALTEKTKKKAKR
jgi:hypothetical protein